MKKFIIILSVFNIYTFLSGEIVESTPQYFEVVHELTVPGSPETVYDLMTGDISGWWDHSFTKDYLKFYIEPFPGGGFYEIFNKSGDGVLHATVIAAQRGKLLRMDGPLGFSGEAVKMVWSVEFYPKDEHTHIKFTGKGFGQLKEGWTEAINKVWYHFLIERFKPYVENKAKNTDLLKK